jgi:ABC-2 type transport system ATP-binding protein
VALIHAGRLAAIGTTTEVKGIFAGQLIIEIHVDRAVEAMRALDDMPEVEKTSLFGTAVHAVLRSTQVRTEQVTSYLRQHGLIVHDVEEVIPSLEDVFLDVVEKAGAAV